MTNNNGHDVDTDVTPRIIAESWFNLIELVESAIPNGDITIKIVNSQPTKVVDWKPDIRLDKKLPSLFLSPKQNKT